MALLSVAAFMFTVLAIPRVAFARPCDEIHYWYYPDSSCSGNPIGGGIRDCNGKWHTQGTVTSIFQAYRDCCWNEGCWEGGYGCAGLPESYSVGCE